MKAASWRVASGYESIPAPTTTTSPFFFSLKPQTLWTEVQTHGHRTGQTGQPDALCLCVLRGSMKYSTWESQLERGWDCVSVCLWVWDRQKGLIQTDHIHKNRWQTQGLPSLFFFSSGSACRQESSVQISRVKKQTGGQAHRARIHTNLHFCGWSLTLSYAPVT